MINLKPIKKYLNLLSFLGFILVFSIIGIISFIGILNISLLFFNPTNENLIIFMSFIVLSLTLSILSYTIANVEKTKEKYKEIGRNFSFSGLLLFLVVIYLKGFGIQKISNLMISFFINGVVLIAFVASILIFIYTIFILLLEQGGFNDLFKKELIYFKKIDTNLRDILIIILVLICIFIIVGYLTPVYPV